MTSITKMSRQTETGSRPGTMNGAPIGECRPPRQAPTRRRRYALEPTVMTAIVNAAGISNSGRCDAELYTIVDAHAPTVSAASPLATRRKDASDMRASFSTNRLSIAFCGKSTNA
ncbi:hypothetical protein D9M73_103560 [compost metagenome]